MVGIEGSLHYAWPGIAIHVYVGVVPGSRGPCEERMA